MEPIWQNDRFYLEIEPSEIPWFKLFTQTPYKEMSDVPPELRFELYERLDAIERALREYFRPDKINLASFGNQLPRVHWHIMARFRDDGYFPEPMWGKPQRIATLELPPLAPFVHELSNMMESL